ncbi:hypothetical protein [Polynucleobacter necessarius]|uniref:hypothetical protein n=1 Tax=Polynucleobacter necessarius TaxID=576610 RepID=UPI000E09C107|nr:hypothetical protein [Polynucleobacter necessarius]
MNMHSSFLKEMGITEWMSRDASRIEAQPAEAPQQSQSKFKSSEAVHATAVTPSVERSPKAHWLFFGSELKTDTQLLFQNIIRALGLLRTEWSWSSPNRDLSQISSPIAGVPVVAVAFGGPATQAITGERDPLPQLRETILALNVESDEEIPVVATLDLNQLIGKPKEKALIWQDLLLARSVLQNS